MDGQYSIGDIVMDGWVITRFIGEGSYGRVFEIERGENGDVHKNALKIITIPRSKNEIISAVAGGADENQLTAFYSRLADDLTAGISAAAELDGSNTVRIAETDVRRHESGTGWDVYIRMELLTQLIEYVQSHTLSRDDIIKLGIDICKALEAGQARGFIHRDIRPENIFLDESGSYKLGDFGIVPKDKKALGALQKKATYTYMSPEMYRGESYDSTADIYSLGIVMYRLLNDHRIPFLPAYPTAITHSDREAALAKRISGVPIPPPKNAGARLADALLIACAHNQSDRYTRPSQMRESLEALSGGFSGLSEDSDDSEPDEQLPDEQFLISPGVDFSQAPEPAPQDNIADGTYSAAKSLWEQPAAATTGSSNSGYSGSYGNVSAPGAGNLHGSGHNRQKELYEQNDWFGDDPFGGVNYSGSNDGINHTGFAGSNQSGAFYQPKREKVVMPPPSAKRSLPAAVKIAVPIAAVVIAALAVFLVFFSQDNGNVRGNEPEDTPISTQEVEPSDSDEGEDTPAPDVSGSTDSPSPIGQTESEYDENNKLIKETLKDVSGDVIGWVEYKYHANGNMSERAKSDASGNVLNRDYFSEAGTLDYRWENKYDANSKRTSATRFDAGNKPVISHEYLYNSSGVNVQRTDRWYEDGVPARYSINDLFEDGEIKTARLYEFDTDRAEVLTETQEFNDGGKMILNTFFEYDENGDVSRRIEHEYDGLVPLLRLTHEYNSSGVKTLITEYDYDVNDELTERREKDLNNRGNVIRTRYYRPGAATPYRIDPPPSAAPPPSSVEPSAEPTPEPTPETPVPPCGGGPGHGVSFAQTPEVVFDEQGRRYREVYYYSCSCVDYYNEYLYDENGSVISITRYPGPFHVG